MWGALFSFKGCYIYQLLAPSSGPPEALRAGILQLPPGPLVLGLVPPICPQVTSPPCILAIIWSHGINEADGLGDSGVWGMGAKVVGPHVGV